MWLDCELHGVTGETQGVSDPDTLLPLSAMTVISFTTSKSFTYRVSTLGYGP